MNYTVIIQLQLFIILMFSFIFLWQTFTAAPVTPNDARKSRFSSSNQSITSKTIQNIDGFIHKSTDGQSRGIFFLNLTLRDKSFQRAFFSSSKKNSDRTSSDVEVRKSSSALRAVRQHNYASKVILKQEICIQCKTRYVFLVEIGL